MNIFKSIFKKLSTRLKTSAERNFIAIVDSLPHELNSSKEYTKNCSDFHFSNWEEFPEFQFVMCRLPKNSLEKYSNRTINKKLSGIQVYSNKSKDYIDIELLIRNNYISGVKVPNHDLRSLDTTRIDLNKLIINEFDFPEEEVDRIYKSLPDSVKDKIVQSEMMELEFENRIFFTIYDLEDGNYLAIDKNHNVYSLIHDANPTSKKMKIDLKSLINDLTSDNFNISEHFDERYKNSA